MRDAIARHPVGAGKPEDIANACFGRLLINELCHGACITVDGGMTAASPLNPDCFDEICTYSLPGGGVIGPVGRPYFWPRSICRFMTLT